jgi:outer membrane protein, heavy metal efflux system
MSRFAPAVLSCLIVAPSLLAQEASGTRSLSDLVREAVDRNPEVQMAARAVEAKRARVGQAGALPDPMLLYGVINEGRPVPFQTLGERDFSEAYVGITQDLPYPGKRRLRSDAAREEAEASESALEAVRRRVAADVADAYYDLYATQAAVGIVDESDRLLEQLIKVANTRLGVGQASPQDVLDAEVEVSRIEEKRGQLFQRKAILEAPPRPPAARPPEGAFPHGHVARHHSTRVPSRRLESSRRSRPP